MVSFLYRERSTVGPGRCPITDRTPTVPPVSLLWVENCLHTHDACNAPLIPSIQGLACFHSELPMTLARQPPINRGCRAAPRTELVATPRPGSHRHLRCPPRNLALPKLACAAIRHGQASRGRVGGSVVTNPTEPGQGQARRRRGDLISTVRVHHGGGSARPRNKPPVAYVTGLQGRKGGRRMAEEMRAALVGMLPRLRRFAIALTGSAADGDELV